jgi:hypothetical protein
MSEKPSNPEKKKPQPLFDDCNHCGKKYQLTAVNTILNIYDKQPDCNNVVCKCKHCNQFTKMFINDTLWEQAYLNGIPEAEQQDYADDTTYQQMLVVRGIELVEPVEITDRHEKLVAGLGKTLQTMFPAHADVFWDEMNSPNTYRPYPTRWT